MEDRKKVGISMGSDGKVIETHDYLIIGGGIAGLAAANRLVDLGISPTIVDAGSFPSHKVCGEFISHECHKVLEGWGLLPPTVIRSIRFHVGNKAFSLPLPREARSASRYSFDYSLFQRAVRKGAAALTKKEVKKIIWEDGEKKGFCIYLEDGNVLRAGKLLIGTGRVSSLLLGQSPRKVRYLGFKAHFEELEIEDFLEMFILPQGYLGMSAIGDKKVNVACIADIKAVQMAGSPHNYLKEVMEFSPQKTLKRRLARGKRVYEEWMTAKISEFQRSPNLSCPYRNLFLIGDAASGIAPVSGDGLAMGIMSGVMAADFAIKGDDHGYRQEWMKTYSQRIRWARRIHRLMFHPNISKAALNLCARCPGLFNFLYHRTRG